MTSPYKAKVFRFTMEHPISNKWQWERGNSRCIFNSWYEAMLFAILIAKYRVGPRTLRIWFHYEGICTICGREVDLGLKSNNPLRVTTDHITPICKGGLHANTNRQLAHDICNRAKGGRTNVPDIEWLRLKVDIMQGRVRCVESTNR